MITALVPIKNESERLKNKNFLFFNGQPLYQIVLDTLQKNEMIDRVIINTDSDIIANDCKSRYPKVEIIERPEYLKGNSITMNSLIDFDLSQIEGQHFLQTHVTNPLITEETITKAINAYFEGVNEFDSLFTVENVKKRVYSHEGEAINHSNLILEQTQNLKSVNIENSNLFLFSRSSFYASNKSRIGKNPQLFHMSAIEGIDIDYKEDFILAELIAKNRDAFN